ncbi:Guanine nucleotide-binding protein G(I)/G(S)/G(O) subunit gamma-12 [Colius striatus]|uniref:Guanine nucleotide-binding protein subunit gamma n=1 Tax=Colius striatus TaxID=57412 RepID=A0A091K0S1_COLST|nr:Guanine nucleotide-binding protein G(I)/G(S)/G(O) subunit gamma-12 [Colius striatus]
MSGKTATTTNNIAQARRTVQQLRIEASIERIKVRARPSSPFLLFSCEEHAKKDPLLMGIPTSENPFKDKKTCILL